MRTLWLLCLVGFALSGQPKGESEAKKTRLEGRVLTAAGAAVPRATVLARIATPTAAADLTNPRSATADEEGRFILEGAPPGTYYVIAQKPGFVNQYAGARSTGAVGTPFTLAPEQAIIGIEIHMTPQSVVSGTITNPEGDPVERISVSLHRDGYVRGLRQLAPAGTNLTDDRGNFRIPNVAPGRYYLTAGAGLFAAFENKPVERNAPKEVLVTTFYPNATTPAAAAMIDVAAGTEVSGINVRMLREKTFTIRVRAVDVSGNLVPNSALIVNDKNGVFGSSIAAAVAPPRSADGRFEFTGLLPGNYSIVAPPPSTLPDRNGFPPAPALKGRTDVTITDEDLNDVEVRLYQGVEITASVRAEEGAEDAAKQPTLRLVLGEYEIPGFNNRGAARDPDGVFRMKDVALSTYAVSLTPLPRGIYVKSVRFAGQDVTRQPLVLTGGGSLDILLSAKAADLSGTIRDAKGDILIGAYVAAWPVIPERSTLEGGTRIVRSTASGAFRIDNLPPGDYYLAAWDQADEGRIGNAAFRALFVSDALNVKLEENSHAAHDPKPIPVDRVNAQLAR